MGAEIGSGAMTCGEVRNEMGPVDNGAWAGCEEMQSSELG